MSRNINLYLTFSFFFKYKKKFFSCTFKNTSIDLIRGGWAEGSGERRGLWTFRNLSSSNFSSWKSRLWRRKGRRKQGIGWCGVGGRWGVGMVGVGVGMKKSEVDWIISQRYRPRKIRSTNYKARSQQADYINLIFLSFFFLFFFLHLFLLPFLWPIVTEKRKRKRN